MKEHRYPVGAEVESVTGIKAKVLELVPIRDARGEPNYRVQTELGKAVWPDDALK